ncbi:MAG: 2,3-bisphosphoglycerate-independent phosphoglycerate mutase [Candidatus Nezhaarchaeota archaeon]|nr:2,3-bisphosphoglycerate-independent phosphoglycerate mutase [Candidatus Nezhaarchaeota archaeon]
MKAIIIIGDGMADRPLEELNFMTPLEATKVNNMNWLASNGISGLLCSTVPESDVANLAVFGYDPSSVYTGRGGFEAVGAGVQLSDEDLAFRCDFATINEDFVVIDERAGRVREEAAELAEFLQDMRLKSFPDVELLFKQSLGFKGVLILRGEGLSANVHTSPPRLNHPADLIWPLDGSLEAKKTCEVLRELIRTSYILLKDHPINKKRRLLGKPMANVVIPWGVGKRPYLQPFSKKYKLRAACIAAARLIRGIAKLADMTVIDVPGATGEVDTNTRGKAEAALRALKNHDVVFVHVGGPDEASHDGDINGKILIIKKIDEMVGLILENVMLEDTCLVLLADHVTSTKLRRHTNDPAPITIAGAKVLHDGVLYFNEKAAAKGSLGKIRHLDVIPILLKIMES